MLLFIKNCNLNFVNSSRLRKIGWVLLSSSGHGSRYSLKVFRIMWIISIKVCVF